MRRLGLILFGSALMVWFMLACGPTEFEQGQKAFEAGNYLQAIELLTKAKEKNDNVVKAEEMIATAKIKIEEQKDQDCVDQGKNYQEMLKKLQSVPDEWEKLIQKVKEWRCRKYDPKPVIKKAYDDYFYHLTYYDRVPRALQTWCELNEGECGEYKVRTRIMERSIEVEEIGEDGKPVLDSKGKPKMKDDTEQKEVRVSDFEPTMKMMVWLANRDIRFGRVFARYASNLYKWRLYEDSQKAYERILTVEKLSFQVRQEAEVTVKDLKSGNRRKKQAEEEDIRMFWAEEAKTKSKVKKVLSEVQPKDEEAAKKEGQAN